MRLKKFSIVALGLVVALTAGISASEAAGKALKSWESPDQITAALLKNFVHGDEDQARRFLVESFKGQVDPDVVVSTYRNWVQGEKLHTVEKIHERRIGQLLIQDTYAIQKESRNILFLQAHFSHTPSGWVIYNLRYSTNLETYFPGWVNPN